MTGLETSIAIFLAAVALAIFGFCGEKGRGTETDATGRYLIDSH